MMSLHVIAKFEYLGEIRKFVGEIARAGGFSAKDIYDIQLTADEAASNIIEHAYEGVKNGVLEISCGVKDGAIIIMMVDHGKSFDPSTIPPPDLKADLSECKIGGLGIFLMRKLMDEVHYESRRDESNVLKIDLLQKSMKFMVVHRSDQIETQGKSLSAIAVPLTQDPKDLQFAKSTLNHDPLASQRPIALLLLLGQRMIFRFLERCLAVFMQFCQALVASIRQDPNMLCNVQSIVLEQLKVMLAALAKGGDHDFSGFLVGNHWI